MTRRPSAQLITIFWRDIPAQVNAQVGRDRNQVLLPAKFQRAIDRAKRKAGIVTAEADVAQWRRETRALSGEPQATAEAEAARLDAAYSTQRLGRLAFVGGFQADVEPSAVVEAAELAALEEIEPEHVPPQTPSVPLEESS